jgi:hypothetical protein
VSALGWGLAAPIAGRIGSQSAGPALPNPRPVSHYMSVPVAVELMRERHGQEGASKIIKRELQRSRRARSRRRFQFWTVVAAQLGA